MKCDKLQRYSIRGVMFNGEEICGGFAYYDADEVDAAIAELKDKCNMHDFFWEGCGFAKRGFKNTIAVSEAYDFLEAENAQLKESIAVYQRNEKIDIRELRHQKYKRCLAMAERCSERFHHYAALSAFSPNKGAVPFYDKMLHKAYRWKYKWLELAEQFKEMK